MHILIINRWDDGFSDYGAYLDHGEHEVGYVTVPAHVPRVPLTAKAVEVVAADADDETILAAARRCRDQLGGIDRVLALSEFNLHVGGRIRDEFGVPGPGADDLLRFRDKPLMKETVARAGLRVPFLAVVRNPAEVADFVAEAPGAVVVKPRAGAAARGVRIIPHGADATGHLDGVDFDDLHAEEFIPGTIWHVDGLMWRAEPWFACASRYIGTPLGFSLGEPTASVCDHGPDGARVREFALRCLDALGLTDGAFHLEVIDAPGGPVFLEVGARVGGGHIAWTVRDIHGIDLVEAWIRVQLGEEPAAPAPFTDRVGGALLIPGPAGHRVRRVESLLGRVEGLYEEVLAAPGTVLGADEELLAGLRFAGDDPERVRAAMAEAVELLAAEFDDGADVGGAALLAVPGPRRAVDDAADLDEAGVADAVHPDAAGGEAVGSDVADIEAGSSVQL
ncbi:hypothetical protein ABH920_006563 [Catenulispora sp. EB89]|uniref:ATP-grasp domain-containing protein n=1 Tax=Catenulispora sp. EB89 TaxID=3156257 RepID=UPI0035111529